MQSESDRRVHVQASAEGIVVVLVPGPTQSLDVTVHITGSCYACAWPEQGERTHMCQVANAHGRVNVQYLLELLANADLHQNRTSTVSLGCQQTSPYKLLRCRTFSATPGAYVIWTLLSDG